MHFITQSGLISNLVRTPVILEGVLNGVTPDRARTATDGPGGWSVIEIVCHLRDFDGYFQERCQLMVEQDNPMLPAFDHLAIAREERYIDQDLSTAFAEYLASRRRFISLVESLTEDQLDRTGIHPESGPITVRMQSIRGALHDIDHTEQIVRCLGLADRFQI